VGGLCRWSRGGTAGIMRSILLGRISFALLGRESFLKDCYIEPFVPNFYCWIVLPLLTVKCRNWGYFVATVQYSGASSWALL
jgi:hypothetical protein